MDSLRLGGSSYSLDFLVACKDIFDVRPELIWSLDTEYRVIDFNPAFAHTIFQASGATVVSGMDIWETNIFGDEIIEVWKNHYAKVFQHQLIVSFITGDYPLKGFEALSEVRLYPILNDAGTVVKAAGIAVNIDDRVSVRRKLEKANAELQQSMELYRTLASQTPNFGVVIFDRDYRFLLCEGTALKAVGLNKQHYEGRTMFESMEAYEIEALKPKYDNALAGNFTAFDHKVWGRDYHVQILPIADGNGIVTRGMVIVNDITDVKRAEHLLADANRKLEEEVLARTKQIEDSNKELRSINQYLDDFVHAAAHDLRSPLVNLKTILDLMERIEDVKEKEMLFNRMPELVNGIANTLDGLIRMVELQKKDQLLVSCLRFDVLLNNAMKFFADRIKKQDVEIISDFEQAACVWYIEPKLQSIFYNLISNSLKYARTDGKVKIRISSAPEGEDVVLKFWDNGIGIDLERHKNSLFKPFKRFAGDNVTGTGLGLSLVKSIAEKNGGSIEVESCINEFTLFTVRLKPYKAL